MKLFIANIPGKLKKTALIQLLTQYGQVASVKMLEDGKALVEMPVSEQAQKAIEGLNGKELYGAKIVLEQAGQ